ncbi:MAG: tRNA (adenosine(37)-N6)-threonylcarbamoyltransferase complex transferase subunit TsaD, partial [Bdellovibrionaceae bacterium]|nr:tRNA (adenosine(37)-N6)-threonylcarbamoyltransferase complex transferase subunit TsaD [Pseudobdellovibrionaceae bacterium]
LMTAKSLAMAKGLPLIGVNHLEGHLLAPFLRDEEYEPPPDFNYPFLALAVSGGHTSLYEVLGLGKYRVLGSTKDDAAGEAYDKFAKLIGLGFPGGVRVDRLAASGDPKAYDFPRPMLHDETYDMSFSGIKSAAQRLVQNLGSEKLESLRADLCASFQEAIVEVLLSRVKRAVRLTGLKRVIITGGVSANSRLRAVAQDWAKRRRVELVIPPVRYCTDNAAMIGYAGVLRLNRGERSDMTLGPSPQSLPGDFL